MKQFSILACCAALAACSSPQSSEETLLQHGYSASYVAGYHDGCPSGKRAGGDLWAQHTQEVAAASSGSDYETGWNYGFIQCRDTERRNEVIAGTIGSAIAAGMGSSHGADGVDARKILSGVDTSGLQGLGY